MSCLKIGCYYLIHPCLLYLCCFPSAPIYLKTTLLNKMQQISVSHPNDCATYGKSAYFSQPFFFSLKALSPFTLMWVYERKRVHLWFRFLTFDTWGSLKEHDRKICQQCWVTNERCQTVEKKWSALPTKNWDTHCDDHSLKILKTGYIINSRKCSTCEISSFFFLSETKLRRKNIN